MGGVRSKGSVMGDGARVGPKDRLRVGRGGCG